MTDLTTLRAQLDAVNADLATLLAQRFRLVDQVAVYKAAHQLPVADPAREAAIRRAVCQVAPDHQAELAAVFDTIFAQSRHRERTRKEELK